MDEPQSRIGTALFVAALLAIFAITVAEAFGFIFFEPSDVAEERHAHIFEAVAACLNGGAIATKEIIVDCKPRGKR